MKKKKKKIKQSDLRMCNLSIILDWNVHKDYAKDSYLQANKTFITQQKVPRIHKNNTIKEYVKGLLNLDLRVIQSQKCIG